MSSINSYFTMQYSQPEEYHFSHDSVFLARYVFEWVRQNTNFQFQSVADLCSGCGIVGLDFLIHLYQNKMKLPDAIDFVEVQNTYRNHFEHNVSQFQLLCPSDIRSCFINQNYAELSQQPLFFDKYDLIICNPPYFNLGQGKLSPSEFKNRCRFFIDSDFDHLLKSIHDSLKNQGAAFVLLRSLKDHKLDYDLKKLSQSFGVDLEIVCDIRGTDVLKIQKSVG